jgi:hypothetical protein
MQEIASVSLPSPFVLKLVCPAGKRIGFMQFLFSCIKKSTLDLSKMLLIVSDAVSYSSNTSLCEPVRAATSISCS